jgi:hypothetical protein
MLIFFSMPIRRTTRASSPGRFGICTSTRADGVRAPNSSANARSRSVPVRIPTSRSSSSTGTQPM